MATAFTRAPIAHAPPASTANRRPRAAAVRAPARTAKISKKNEQIFTGKINSGQITHIEKTGVSVGDLVNVNIVDSTPFYLKAEKI